MLFLIIPALQNTTLLKACMDGNEDNIESIVNMSLPELNVVCVGEAGLSPLHYAVKNRLKRGLAAMVQHTTFTLSATDKVRHIGVFIHVSVYVEVSVGFRARSSRPQSTQVLSGLNLRRHRI